MATEQERALEYRRQQQAREDNRLEREQAMAGSASALEHLKAITDPIRRWRGWDPIRRVKGDPE